MRTFWRWTLVLVVAASGVATAWPQEQRLPRGTTVKLLLLRQKSVQKELGITPDVAKKIRAFTDRQSEAAGKAIEMDEAQRKKAFDQLEEQNKQFLANTLTEKQSKRLDQIALQFTALRQLTKPEAAKALSLTKDQQQKFKALHTEYRKELAEVLFGKDSTGRAERFAKLREQTRTKILSLLTGKQKAQVREKVGPPFMGEIVFEEHDPPKKK
jgi:Mg/Co/Ni transporter MgtE